MTEPQSTPTQILPQEEWLPVLGYELLYEVSNYGRVRRIGKASGARVGRMLAAPPGYFGYPEVNLHDGGTPRTFRVHRLVVEAFTGEPIPDDMVVNHIDSNPANNIINNLEIVTQLENIEHSRRAGRHAFGERNGHTTLRTQDVRAIRLMRRLGAPLADIADIYGISKQSVCDITKGRSWKHVA